MLEGVEPALVWDRFLELTRIARPSKGEGAVREHVLEWARARGLTSRVDEEGNVVVDVPATAGRETAPTVALQSHLDMVCERDPSSPFDPREGRIDVRVEGDWVRAEGTTLGADNGIGVAAALSVAEDSELPHGPLELLFTVSEEQGLTGARMLDPSLVSGRLLVNLDGTSDAGFTVGCAGSIHTYVRRYFDVEIPQARGLELHISGARGGHSGEDIASGRANANKALGRILGHILDRSSSSIPFLLVLLEGGVSRNAIPREARAVVAASDLDDLRGAAFVEFDALRDEFAATDPELALEITPIRLRYTADESSTVSLVHLLRELPTGVIELRPDSSNVQTSTSLTVVQTDEELDLVTFGSMTRSAQPEALEEVAQRIGEIAEEADAEVEVVRSYPPWQPDPSSRLLARARGTWARLFGSQPVLTVVHGGLECAVLKDKLPGVEMLAIGPEVVGPHAPGEKVSISSTQRFYRLLGALLDDLSS